MPEAQRYGTSCLASPSARSYNSGYTATLRSATSHTPGTLGEKATTLILRGIFMELDNAIEELNKVSVNLELLKKKWTEIEQLLDYPASGNWSQEG